MDAKNNIEVISEIKTKILNCNSKLESEISIIKNEWQIINSYFEGIEAQKFMEETQAACDSIYEILSSLHQMSAFLDNLDTKIIEYNETCYLR